MKIAGAYIQRLRINGITVIELTLVTAIIASVFMMAVPFFESASPAESIEEQAEKLAAEIINVQKEAKGKSRQYCMHFMTSSDLVSISTIESGGKEKEVKRLSLGAGIDIADSTFPDDIIFFNDSGIPLTEGVVRIRDASGRKASLKLASDTGKVIIEIEN